VVQPAGVRVRTDEQEKVSKRTGVSRSSRAITKHRRGEACGLVTLQSDHFGIGADLHSEALQYDL